LWLGVVVGVVRIMLVAAVLEDTELALDYP
jgi:hypothetical protein